MQNVNCSTYIKSIFNSSEKIQYATKNKAHKSLLKKIKSHLNHSLSEQRRINKCLKNASNLEEDPGFDSKLCVFLPQWFSSIHLNKPDNYYAQENRSIVPLRF